MKLLKQFIAINKRASSWLADTFPACFSGGDYRTVLRTVVENYLKESQHDMHVLEVGGIDRPLLQKQPYLIYDGLDIEEKPSCHNIYNHFHVQSVESQIKGPYDVIVSITLLEHVPNNTAAMQSMYQALKNDGLFAHYMPSKYHPYSLILRLVGPKLQRKIISCLRPWAADVTGYPAYFNHCSPAAMKKVMSRIGYKDIHTSCFYRAADYFSFLVPLFVLVCMYENMCRLFRLKALCSGFIINARK